MWPFLCSLFLSYSFEATTAVETAGESFSLFSLLPPIAVASVDLLTVISRSQSAGLAAPARTSILFTPSPLSYNNNTTESESICVMWPSLHYLAVVY